ncbi:MAG: Pyrrolo-quinoline quinone [Candidatus Solibacter sp.]|nr:Pyrrolo-quinoline quinone [Candidatus Solibacter sp.]
MRKTISFAFAVLTLSTAHAQLGRGVAEWSTSGGDAHRSSAVSADAKINKDSVGKGFALFWKMKLNNEPRQLNGLTAPTLMDRHIGIHGFRAFGFVTGSGDNIYAIDTDLARIDWQKNFGGKPLADASLTCPGGMTSGTARSIGAAFPAPQQGGGGRGRGTPAKSAVGQPGEGGVTIEEIQRAQAAAAANPGRGGAGRGPGGGRATRVAVVVNSLSSDGMFHANFVSNGDEPEPPVRFLPPNANAQGLVIVDNVAYVATVNGCGGVPNGIWALDIPTKTVTSWKPASGGVAGSAGPAFGGDGALYVATTTGDVVSLEPKTLKVKDVYRAGTELTSTPVVFQQKEKTWLAATTKDGRLHVIDAAAMSAAGVKSAAYSTAADFTPGALSTWQDSAGVRWILAPTAGPVSADAKFSAANGAVTNGAIVAWKVVDQNGAPALEPGWVSRDLISPLSPLVVNGVVFAVSSGEARGKDAKTVAQRSVPAVVYALDAATGKELWNSGKTITSFVHGGGLSGASGQIYLGTHDGTLYSFGFPIEH